MADGGAWRFFSVLGGIAAAFGIYEVATSFVAFTNDAFVQADLVAVAPQVTGQVVAVHVADNQPVARGDRLLSLDPVPFQLLVAGHQADIEEATAQEAADQAAIALTTDAQASAAATLLYMRDNQRRLAVLGRAQDVSRADLERANDSLTRAVSANDAAQAGIAQAHAVADMHRAGKARTVAAMATAQWRLARTEILSPATGTVTSLTMRPGDTAQENVPAIGIVDAGSFRIIANYKQGYLRDLTVGGTAWVWLDSAPWHFHRARIAGIARGISRDPVTGPLLAYVAPTTDWIRLQRRFPVTLTLVDHPADDRLFMGADARVAIFP